MSNKIKFIVMYDYTLKIEFQDGTFIERGCNIPRKAIEFAKCMIGYKGHYITKNN